MKNELRILRGLFVLLFAICAVSCSLFFLDSKSVKSTISLPNSFSRYGDYTGGGYYLTVELVGLNHQTEKFDITEDELETGTKEITISEIPIGSSFTLKIDYYNEYQDLASTEIITEHLFKASKEVKNFDPAMKIDEITWEEVETRPNTPTPTGKYNVGDLILTDESVVKYDSTNFNAQNYAQYADQAVAVIFREAIGDEPALGVGVKQTYCNWVANTNVPGYTATFSELKTTLGNGKYIGHTDGSTSWNKIIEYFDNNTDLDENQKEQGKNIENYPVFHFANNYPTVYFEFEDNSLQTKNYEENYLGGTNYSTGWYIPTANEFADIKNNAKTINQVLTNLEEQKQQNKYDDFYEDSIKAISTEWYWTSNWNSTGCALWFSTGSQTPYGIDMHQKNDNIFYVLAIRKFY